MHYADHRTQHPVPLNEITPLPCGCLSERVERGTEPGNEWGYITRVKPGCRFDGGKVGTRKGGMIFVSMDADAEEIARAWSR